MSKRKTVNVIVKMFKHTEHRTQVDKDGKKICRKVIKWDKNGNFKSQHWVKYD